MNDDLDRRKMVMVRELLPTWLAMCRQLCAAVQIPCDPNISIVEALEGSFRGK
jgi:hypothetical protein